MVKYQMTAGDLGFGMAGDSNAIAVVTNTKTVPSNVVTRPDDDGRSSELLDLDAVFLQGVPHLAR